MNTRGIGNAIRLQSHVATGEPIVIETLKVHENIKNHEKINALKTVGEDEVTIETCYTTDESITYALKYSDYIPTARLIMEGTL